MTAAPLSVRCPTCKQKVIWNEQSPFKPFCSERCRLIDLGDWATEAHKIAGEPQAIELSDQPDGDLHY